MRILLLIGLVIVRASESQSKTRLIGHTTKPLSILTYFRPLGWRPPNTNPKYELITTKILSGGSSKALIRETSSNQTYYVGIGNQVQDTKVEKIEGNQISLNIGNQPISLSDGYFNF